MVFGLALMMVITHVDRASARRPADPPAVVEAGIAARINAYRKSLGLPAVPRSRLLDEVAQTHVEDLAEHHPDRGPCNPHSWSRAGSWRPVCYTGTADVAPAMWSKPREITHGAYWADGFEIALIATGPITAERAVEDWKRSPEHIDLVREVGMWRGAHWRAMGVGVGHGYAVVWFGKQRDLTF